MEKYFRLKENNTTVKTEFVAGITTFMTMAYILIVNPSILSVTIYVKDMKDFADMNSVWDAWVTPGFEPARACVEARMARESLLVEMTVTAAVK